MHASPIAVLHKDTKSLQLFATYRASAHRQKSSLTLVILTLHVHLYYNKTKSNTRSVRGCSPLSSVTTQICQICTWSTYYARWPKGLLVLVCPPRKYGL